MDQLEEYYDQLNDGCKYFCDRCGVCELNQEEFINNIYKDLRLCEPCFNHSNMKNGECECGAKHSIRTNTRVFVKKCMCGKEVLLN